MNNTYLKKLNDWLKLIILAGVTVFILRGFIFIPMAVSGNSMENSLHERDQIVYEKFSKIERFDTIIFEGTNGSTYIKRVIGLPGERVAYIGNQLFIDGKKMKESFWKDQGLTGKEVPHTANFDTSQTLPTGHLTSDGYFVIGDNRLLSEDSRSFGEIKNEQIIGKARFIYYPINHFGTIK